MPILHTYVKTKRTKDNGRNGSSDELTSLNCSRQLSNFSVKHKLTQ